jgi:hypothetical protein
MTNNTKIKTPHGLVVIYNYRDRFGDTYVSDKFEVDQIILNSGSLKSITTQKSKNNPAGSFELKLAPTKNWTSAITPGSWCVLLISNYQLNDQAKQGDSKTKTKYVDPKSFKMLGRIESVRGVVNTDQLSGKRQTEYIVTGSDWGTVFNNSLYIDPLDRLPDQTPIGMAQRFDYVQYLENSLNYTKGLTKEAPKKTPSSKDSNTNSVILNADEAAKAVEKNTAAVIAANKDKPAEPVLSKGFLPNGTLNVNTILKLWGSYQSSTAGQTNLLGNAQHQFKIPKELSTYMRFDNQDVASLIRQYSGILTAQDKGQPNAYTNDDPSVGIIHFDSVFGENNVWQLLNQNFNDITCELIADIRFEGDKPNLALYNRVMPFIVNKDKMEKDSYKVDDKGKAQKIDILKNFISEFRNVRQIKIDSDDVMLSSFGTNWRDKVNFIEVNIDRSLLFNQAYAQSIKLDSQFYDEHSIGRDGLRSRRVSGSYVPRIKDKDGTSAAPSPLSSFAYKYLLKELYFNTHNMLNGTLNLIGQDQYIQVGDNIKVDAKVLDINYNFNNNQLNSKKAYLLAHVEGISHNIAFNESNRIFTTSINFVRGIIVDENDNIISASKSTALDQDASLLSEQKEANLYVSKSSSDTDPDREKL